MQQKDSIPKTASTKLNKTTKSDMSNSRRRHTWAHSMCVYWKTARKIRNDASTKAEWNHSDPNIMDCTRHQEEAVQGNHGDAEGVSRTKQIVRFRTAQRVHTNRHNSCEWCARIRRSRTTCCMRTVHDSERGEVRRDDEEVEGQRPSQGGILEHQRQQRSPPLPQLVLPVYQVQRQK